MIEIEIDIIELEKYRTLGAKNKKKKVAKSKKSLKDIISESFSYKKDKPEKEKFPWESDIPVSKVPGMYSVK